MARNERSDSRWYPDLVIERLVPVLKVLVLFAALWLAASMLAGCDGAGYEQGDDAGGEAGAGDVLPAGPGLKHFPNGYPYCEVPSPTGDAPSTKVGVSARDLVMSSTEAGTPRFVVVDAAAARSTCEAYVPSAATSAQKVGKTCSEWFEAGCPSGGEWCRLASFTTLPLAECDSRVTREQCRNPANDFLDSAGVRHAFSVTCPEGKSMYDEDSGCQAAALVPVFPDPQLGSGRDPSWWDKVWRTYALCGTDGSFVGWWST